MDVNEYGDWAPEYTNGIRTATLNAIKARLYTYRGRQIMRPNYGSHLHPEVDRVEPDLIIKAVNQALEGLRDVKGARMIIKGNERRVLVEVEQWGILSLVTLEA